MDDDWNLIEASFAKQYNIRLRHDNDMPWSEFCSLLSGIMPDTPLGQIVSIRSEKDKKIIKNFNANQKRIYNEWQLKIAQNKVQSGTIQHDMKALEREIARAFGGR